MKRTSAEEALRVLEEMPGVEFISDAAERKHRAAVGAIRRWSKGADPWGGTPPAGAVVSRVVHTPIAAGDRLELVVTSAETLGQVRELLTAADEIAAYWRHAGRMEERASIVGFIKEVAGNLDALSALAKAITERASR